MGHCQKKIFFFITVLLLLPGLVLAASASDVRPAPAKLRVLISGFEPFGGLDKNPTQSLAAFVNADGREEVNGVEIKSVVLPVAYHKSWEVLENSIRAWKPDFVLATGFSPGSRNLTIEVKARNRDRGARDNLGQCSMDLICPEGATWYSTGLPVEKVSAALKKRYIPVRVSQDAGGYLCNHVFYHLMHYAAVHPEMSGALIHLPNWSVAEEKGLWEAVKTIIEVIRENSAKVAVIEFEPEKDQIEKNLEAIEKIVSVLRLKRVRFVLFPEMALSGLQHDSVAEFLKKNPMAVGDQATKTLSRLALETGLFLGVGMAVSAGRDFYNAYRIWSPDGRIIYEYRKNHLYGSDHLWAKAGDAYPVIDLPFGRIGVLICHDVVYKESFTTYHLEGVNILVVGSNWIGETSIQKYLASHYAPNLNILISDRKGIERNAKFYGNTAAVLGDTVYPPTTIAGSVRGVLVFIVDRNASE